MGRESVSRSGPLNAALTRGELGPIAGNPSEKTQVPTPSQAAPVSAGPSNDPQASGSRSASGYQSSVHARAEQHMQSLNSLLAIDQTISGCLQWAGDNISKVTGPVGHMLIRQAAQGLQQQSFYETVDFLLRYPLRRAAEIIEATTAGVDRQPVLLEHRFLLAVSEMVEKNPDKPASVLKDLRHWCREHVLRLPDAVQALSEHSLAWLSTFNEQLHSPLARGLARLSVIWLWLEQQGARTKPEAQRFLRQLNNTFTLDYSEPSRPAFQADSARQHALARLATKRGREAAAKAVDRPVAKAPRKEPGHIIDLTGPDPAPTRPTRVSENSPAAQRTRRASVFKAIARYNLNAAGTTETGTAAVRTPLNSDLNQPIDSPASPAKHERPGALGGHEPLYGMNSPLPLEEIQARMRAPTASNETMIELAIWGLPPKLEIEDVNRYRTLWLGVSESVDFRGWLGTLDQAQQLTGQIRAQVSEWQKLAGPERRAAFDEAGLGKALWHMALVYVHGEQNNEPLKFAALPTPARANNIPPAASGSSVTQKNEKISPSDEQIYEGIFTGEELDWQVEPDARKPLLRGGIDLIEKTLEDFNPLTEADFPESLGMFSPDAGALSSFDDPSLDELFNGGKAADEPLFEELPMPALPQNLENAERGI